MLMRGFGPVRGTVTVEVELDAELLNKARGHGVSDKELSEMLTRYLKIRLAGTGSTYY
jgi:hypothetical protein